MKKSCTLALLRKFWGILTGARKSGENRPESQKDCAMSAGFWMWQDEFGIVWCCESLVGENKGKDINVEGSFPFFSLSCMQH